MLGGSETMPLGVISLKYQLVRRVYQPDFAVLKSVLGFFGYGFTFKLLAQFEGDEIKDLLKEEEECDRCPTRWN
jgi:hypothetical protein